jgi:hypothetical protein
MGPLWRQTSPAPLTYGPDILRLLLVLPEADPPPQHLDGEAE